MILWQALIFLNKPPRRAGRPIPAERKKDMKYKGTEKQIAWAQDIMIEILTLADKAEERWMMKLEEINERTARTGKPSKFMAKRCARELETISNIKKEIESAEFVDAWRVIEYGKGFQGWTSNDELAACFNADNLSGVWNTINR